jgi:DNA-binding transcriptional ArsR family regulator
VSDPGVIAALLADPTRVQILEALSERPMRSNELARRVGATTAALSRHLNQLRQDPLNELAEWIRRATWASKLAAASTEPAATVLLARMGGFLDAFAARDVAYFEQWLRDDAVLIFPGTGHVFDKAGCIAAVAAHGLYRHHHVVGEPAVQRAGESATVLTLLVDTATSGQAGPQRMFVSAVFDETDPWQLVHLQWTPGGPPGPSTIKQRTAQPAKHGTQL